MNEPRLTPMQAAIVSIGLLAGIVTGLLLLPWIYNGWPVYERWVESFF